MTEDIKKCPDCSGELEKGLIVDFTYGGMVSEKFAVGATSKQSNFVANSVKNLSTLKDVIAYNCLKCHRVFHFTAEGTANYKDARNQGLLIVALIFVVILGPLIFMMLMSALSS